MPTTSVPVTFRDSAGRPLTIRYATVDEPTSPATEAPGTAYDVRYTPAASNETLVAGVAGGPTGRARMDVSLDGGSSWHALPYALGGTAGVEMALKLREVGLPFADALDLDPTRFGIGVVAPGVDAGWLD